MTDRKLRSNFTPGTTPWAMRRAQWSALGLSDEDLEKPKIAIVNSSSQLASCFSHLDQVVGPLKRAIEDAGGVAFEVRTAAPSDAITSAGAAGQYILPSRDLIASDIEVAVEGALLDGMVCLASCDKTTPGQLMAAGRLNIPTIIVGCGYQPSGMYQGEAVDFEDIFRFAGHVNAGRMTVSELGEMSRCAVTGPGVCAGMGTANSMHLAAEALGMALPGTHAGAGAGRQDVGRRRGGGRADRVADARGRDAPVDHDPRRVRQRGHRDLVGGGLGQLPQAPAGDRGRGGHRRGRVPAVRGAGAEGAAAHRRQAQRRHPDHRVRRGRRHPGAAAAARPAARPVRSDRGRGDARRGASPTRRRMDDGVDPAAVRAAGVAPGDHGDARVAGARRRRAQADRRGRRAADVPRAGEGGALARRGRRRGSAPGGSAPGTWWC